MKKINLVIALVAISVFGSTAYAEVSLESKDQVQGTWKLKQTRTSGKQPIERQDTWVFKDGSVTILHIPREGTFYDQPPVNFEVENGKLKVAILGRPTNFETFTVETKDDKAMTLKGKFDTFYDFVKK